MNQSSKAIIDECDEVIKQANKTVEYSAAASGHKFKSVVTEKGISLLVDGVELLKDATAEEAQLFQRAVGLAAHKLNVNDKMREEAQKKRTEKSAYRKRKGHEDPNEPAYWQEAHSPTEAIDLKVGHEGKKVLTSTRQRKQDARLFDGLTEEQQQAMVDILDGFNYIARSVAGKIMIYEDHIPSTADGPNYYEELYFLQKAWARVGQRGRFNLPMAQAVIIEGKSLRRVAVEHNTQIRNVKNNLIDSLDEYRILRHPGRKYT